jgi:hypothetical protein
MPLRGCQFHSLAGQRLECLDGRIHRPAGRVRAVDQDRFACSELEGQGLMQSVMAWVFAVIHRGRAGYRSITTTTCASSRPC